MPRKRKVKPQEIYIRLSAIDHIYSPHEADLYFDTIGDLPVTHNNKGVAYYNVPIAFDIETSSFYDYREEDLYELQEQEAQADIYSSVELWFKNLRLRSYQTKDNRLKDIIRKSGIRFTKDGQKIDVFYSEISEQYPYLFPSHIVSVEDQIELLCAVYKEIKNFRSEQIRRVKTAVMYEWTLNICGLTMIGRTREEFLSVYEKLCNRYHTGSNQIMTIYVHNLSFEFQFIRKWFTWKNVFALEVREPVKARTAEGIEFKCSYKLSGYSLQKVGENLLKYPVQKMAGDLDYKLIRHNRTPLTDKEIGYCVNDCKVVVAYILEEIERNRGQIILIPLTKTGYVRRYCRKAVTKSGTHDKTELKTFKRARDLIKGLTISADEYPQLKRAFTGGYTHASCFYSGQICEDVTSYDFTSSYPAVIIAEQYPMSKAKLIKNISKQEFLKSIRLYCCIFDIHLTGVQAVYLNEHILSESKCKISGNCQTDNGRIVYADDLYTTVTEVDYDLLTKFYKWDSMEIANFRRYIRGYLPTEFIKAILKLYADKTQLKGVEGKEAEYLSSKEQLNSAYGMMVTDICRPDITYSDEWEEPAAKDIIKAMEDYNKSKSRFLFYPWGIYVTAYARRNLILYGIIPAGDDYIYSDTDSIKILNGEEHQDLIDRYNELITKKIQRALKYHGIDQDAAAPKTVKGISKPIGVWDFDGRYKLFKTLGAKRYLVQYPDNEISLTVSGLNKKICVPYLLKKFNIPYHEEDRGGSIHYIADGDVKPIFDYFDSGLYIPPEYTGKNIHTYIDDVQHGYVTDYLGEVSEYEELSSVHLEESAYDMSLPALYVNYIMGVQYEK